MLRHSLLSAAPAMFCCSFGSRHVLLRRTPGVFHCSFCSRHTSVPATTLERISLSDLSPLCRRGVKATPSCALPSSSVYLLYIQKTIVFPTAENITLHQPRHPHPHPPQAVLPQLAQVHEYRSQVGCPRPSHGLLHVREYWRAGCAG